MARTGEGALLTEQHRAAQLAVRAGSLRDLVTLWRAVDPTRLGATIETFARAAAILAGRDFERSSSLSGLYYRLFRTAEGVPGAAVASLAPRPSTEALAGELRGAALKGIITARRGGLSVPLAAERGLVRVTGALTKLVLGGGRMTLVRSALADRQALGWARATSGQACAFCRMLASRGPVYKSEKSADFQSHDDCACTPEVVYEGSTGTSQASEYAEQWAAAQRAARDSGTGSTGTSNNALNNYRRYLAGEQATPSQSAATPPGG